MSNTRLYGTPKRACAYVPDACCAPTDLFSLRLWTGAEGHTVNDALAPPANQLLALDLFPHRARRQLLDDFLATFTQSLPASALRPARA